MRLGQWMLTGVLVVVFGAVTSVVPARAYQSPPNFYFGLGGGIQDVEEENAIDDRSAVAKGFIGLQPSHFFALEGGFTDFGDVEGTVGGSTFERSVEGFYIEGVAILPIASGFDFYAKGGGFRFDMLETSGGVVVTDATGFDPMYGAGFNFFIVENRDADSVESITMEIRTDWEHYTMEPENHDQIEYDAFTLNLVWHFL